MPPMTDPRNALAKAAESLATLLSNNPERLSVPLVNRTLLALVEAQLALLDRLDAMEGKGRPEARVDEEDDSFALHIRGSAVAAGTEDEEDEEEPDVLEVRRPSGAIRPGLAPAAEARKSREAVHDITREITAAAREVEERPPIAAAAATAPAPAAPAGGEPPKEGRPEPIRDGEENRAALTAFGLDNLKRWLDHEQGSLFQMRGDRAYVNLKRMTWTSFEDVRRNLALLGYNRIVGLLDPGFPSDVLLFKK